MSHTGTELAAQLRAITEDFVSTVKDLPEATWQKVAPTDGRQINVITDHMGLVFGNGAHFIECILTDQPLPPLTMDMINAGNDQMAVDHANIGKDEAIGKLKASSEAVATRVSAMPDSDLNKSAAWEFVGGNITPAAVVTMVMVGHAQEHLGAIKGALG